MTKKFKLLKHNIHYHKTWYHMKCIPKTLYSYIIFFYINKYSVYLRFTFHLNKYLHTTYNLLVLIDFVSLESSDFEKDSTLWSFCLLIQWSIWWREPFRETGKYFTVFPRENVTHCLVLSHSQKTLPFYHLPIFTVWRPHNSPGHRYDNFDAWLGDS